MAAQEKEVEVCLDVLVAEAISTKPPSKARRPTCLRCIIVHAKYVFSKLYHYLCWGEIMNFK